MRAGEIESSEAHRALWGIAATLALIAVSWQQRRQAREPVLPHPHADASSALSPTRWSPQRPVQPRHPPIARANARSGLAGLKRTASDVFAKFSEHRLMTIAAGVTYYSLLAIFPGLAALIALYGLFADAGTIAQQLDSLSLLLPGGAVDILREQLTRLAGQHTSLGLAFIVGLLISIWSANTGTKSIFDALNIVHNENEKRSFIIVNLVSLAFTLLGLIFAILAVASAVVLPQVVGFIGFSGKAATAIEFLRWPALLVVLTLFLALIFRFGPSRTGVQWRWITWGSAVAMLCWLVVSLLFTWYAAHFGSFNQTYGSLGAVVGFMTWIWLSTMGILFGAEVDAELEKQTPAQEEPVENA